MISLNPQNIKSQARSRLADVHPDSRRLVLIHVGVILLLNLLASGLSLYLDQQIGGTGGLSGLGTRSVLQSLQTFLRYGAMFVSPFWQAGFVLVCLHWADGRNAAPMDLLSGFRRAGTILAYQLLLLLAYFLIGMIGGYVASMIFTITPFSDSLLSMISTAADGTVDMTALMSLPTDALIKAYTPMLIIYLVVLIPLVGFFAYNLRLSSYFIMGESRLSAFAAMAASFRAMRGNRLKMLKLDFSFWWFYLLEAGLTLICYLDVLMSLLGIAVPFDPTVVYFVTLVLYSALELLLSLWMRAQVDTAYALAYRAITSTPPVET